MKRLFIILSWFSATVATLILSLQTYSLFSKTTALQALVSAQTRNLSKAQSPFLAYASIPQAANDIKTAIRTGDARPVVINLYLTKHDSPMSGYGQVILDTAERYGMDPYLFVAIAQQESNLGKKMPSDDCHNAWGYGIHSRGTLCFPSWEEGIDAVMKGISEKFVAKGLTEPDDIMKIYTPHSNGSWAFGVNQFRHELRTGEF